MQSKKIIKNNTKNEFDNILWVWWLIKFDKIW